MLDYLESGRRLRQQAHRAVQLGTSRLRARRGRDALAQGALLHQIAHAIGVQEQAADLIERWLDSLAAGASLGTERLQSFLEGCQAIVEQPEDRDRTALLGALRGFFEHGRLSLPDAEWALALELGGNNPFEAARLGLLLGTEVLSRGCEGGAAPMSPSTRRFLRRYLERCFSSLPRAVSAPPPSESWPRTQEGVRIPWPHLVRSEDADQQKLSAILSFGIHSRARALPVPNILAVEDAVQRDADLQRTLITAQRYPGASGGVPAVFVEATCSAPLVRNIFTGSYNRNFLIAKLRPVGVVNAEPLGSIARSYMMLGGIHPDDLLELAWFDGQGAAHHLWRDSKGRWTSSKLSWAEMTSLREAFAAGLEAAG